MGRIDGIRRGKGPTAGKPAESQDLIADLAESCRAMVAYALEGGASVPRWIIELLSEIEGCDARPADVASAEGADRSQWIRGLVRAHDHLARLVAPALPQTLLLLRRENRRGGVLRSLGPVRLVRQLMLASLTFLFTFMVTSLSPDVNKSSGDLFTTSGMTLLINQAFFLSAAGIGASFAALFQVNRFIAKGTYDPEYDTSYWTRFILGLIAGIVLAQLIPVEGEFSRPLLALLGGFSASVVYRILTRVVETLESFVSADPPSQGFRDEGLRATATAGSEERLRIATSLIQMQRDANGSGDGTELNKRLQALLDTLLENEGTPWQDLPPPEDADRPDVNETAPLSGQ